MARINMSIDLKFVELTADVLQFFFCKYVYHFYFRDQPFRLLTVCKSEVVPSALILPTPKPGGRLHCLQHRLAMIPTSSEGMFSPQLVSDATSKRTLHVHAACVAVEP